MWKGLGKRMVYKCEKCKCEFEVDIVSAIEDVAFVVCAKCGYGAVVEKDADAAARVQDLENNFKSF